MLHMTVRTCNIFIRQLHRSQVLPYPEEVNWIIVENSNKKLSTTADDSRSEETKIKQHELGTQRTMQRR